MVKYRKQEVFQMSERKKITGTTKKPLTPEEKRKKLALQSTKFKTKNSPDFYSISTCWQYFLFAQLSKGNSKATINFYESFYKKFCKFLEAYPPNGGQLNPDISIELFEKDMLQPVFIDYLKNFEGITNPQTINSYLRAYRAFGNWCEKEGYIDFFKCPIKEVEPPAKQVYTDKELEALLVKPSINHFADFRAYCIISLILCTGARSNTILNIKIEDLDLEEGYITFNTTKAKKVARLGLDKKTRRDLAEWVNYWRIDKGAEPDDFLFCNEYGEQLTRDGLYKSISKYNKKKGVEKTSIHLLRHTFAKKWITSGGDIITLAKVLTHSELEMVKRYSNLYGGDIKKEIEEHSAISQLRTKSGKTLKNQKRKLSDM